MTSSVELMNRPPTAPPGPTANENAVLPGTADSEDTNELTTEFCPTPEKIESTCATVSNTQFLVAVSGALTAGEHLWVCGFIEAPTPTARWGGKSWQPGAPTGLSADANNYFSVAALTDGKRRKKNFSRMMVLVADDCDLEGLTPSYMIETSPGKHQAGYILHDGPETRDEALCTRAIKAMVDKGLVPQDKSGNNAVRYVRLPIGTNTKPRPSGPFAHALRVWEPNRRFTLQQALAEFGVVLNDTTSGQGEAPGSMVEVMPFNLKESLARILTGEVYHDSLLRTAASFAAIGVPYQTAGDILQSLMVHSDQQGSTRWGERVQQIPDLVKSAYTKFASDTADRELSRTAPVDIFSTISAAPVWDANDYPPVVGRLAQDAARRLGVDPLVPAWAAIGGACGLIDDRVQLQPKAHDTDWRESARLWIAIVADPSAKKTPGINAAMSPIMQLQKKWYQQYREALDRRNVAAAFANKNKTVAPPMPSLRKVVVNDATIEALGEVLEDNQGGVLVLHDELAAFFNSMDAYRNSGASKDRTYYLQAYNGGVAFIDRVGKKRMVPNMSVSILGGIQPEPMRRIASKLEEDGLLQRFIVIPARAAGAGEDCAPDISVQRDWAECVAMLADMQVADDTLTMEPDAQKAMDAARKRIHALGLHPGFDNRLRTALQKGEGQLARLTLVFHCLSDQTGLDPFFGGVVPGTTVNLATVEMAIRAYERLVIPSLCAFYTDLVGAGQATKNARWIAGYILAGGAAVVRARDLYRANREFRDEVGRRALMEAMMQLELAGWISAEPSIKLGQSISAWRVNQQVHRVYADKAKQEKARRDKDKADIQARTADLSRLSLARTEAEI